jgi:hypothetical protein
MWKFNIGWKEGNESTEWEMEHWRDSETECVGKWPLENDTWVFQIKAAEKYKNNVNQMGYK